MTCSETTKPVSDSCRAWPLSKPPSPTVFNRTHLRTRQRPWPDPCPSWDCAQDMWRSPRKAETRREIIKPSSL